MKNKINFIVKSKTPKCYREDYSNQNTKEKQLTANLAGQDLQLSSIQGVHNVQCTVG